VVAALAAAAAVAVTGTAQQGQKLSAAADPGASYQWYRCAADASHCNSISGAKAASYTLGAKDVGKTVALTVRTADGTPLHASAVGPVASRTAKLAVTTQPAISGTPAVGQKLTVDNGAWSAAPTGYTYAWLRCNANGRICVMIANATSSSYAPVADDVGHALAVRVTASTGAVAQPTLSAATAAVAAPTGPKATVQPTVAGTPQQGQRLTAVAGTWTGNGPVAFTYQWYRCDAQVSHCASISGAKAAGYKLVAKDVGKTLALTLTAKDADATVTVYLSAVGPVGPATPTVQPKVSGTTTLTVDNGTWKTTPATFTYQWLRCNANGRICVPIAGATQQTYTKTADDDGHSLVATVNGALSTRS
jgi:hypothetical protein